MELQHVLETVKDMCEDAGDEILSYYGGDYDVEEKGVDDPVTVADRAANDVILDGLNELTPGIPVLTEEAEDDDERLDAHHVWIVDPLDGTKEFINEEGEFTVNVALVEEGRPVLGVIHAPAKGQTFFAIRGEGAFLQVGALTKELRVSTVDSVDAMTLTRSRSHATDRVRELADEFDDVVPSGSAVKGCRVANGDADVYVRFRPCHEWDVCAMDLLVHEAGGVMTDFDGGERRYNQEDTLLEGFVASNDVIHDDILARVREL